MTAKRPLRSLLIGDTDRYFSPYIFGVAAASHRLGIWHSQVSIRAEAGVIAQRIRDVKPDIIWTHMLLWAPPGSCRRSDLLALCARARREGARVLIHDGDCKRPTRCAYDISAVADLALCNHKHDRSAWRIPAIHWPYAAFPQDRIATAVSALRCDVAFAGQLRSGGVYDERTRLVKALEGSDLSVRVFSGADDVGNTMFRTPEIAASAGVVLGFGRSDSPGWTDTRVFQYPGAGAVLLHDDAGGFLEPHVHYVPYETGNAEFAVEAARKVKRDPNGAHTMRRTAFAYVQERHSWTVRVREVLTVLGLRSRRDL